MPFLCEIIKINIFYGQTIFYLVQLCSCEGVPLSGMCLTQVVFCVPNDIHFLLFGSQMAQRIFP
jgi:hypothetical protein